MSAVRTFRRVCVAAFYLVAGTAVITFAVLTLLGHVTRVNVETAVISMPVEQVVATDVGMLSELNVQPGMRVAAGQVLFRIDSETSTRNVETAHHELAAAEIALRQAQSRREQEENKLRVYRSIGKDQLEAAQANVAALVAAREEARADFERHTQLMHAGVISRQLYDHEKAILDEREARVSRAIAEQKITATSAGSTSAGLFFSGNFLVGDVNGAIAEENAARERVRAAHIAIEDAVRHDARRVYRTPFDGIVLRVLKSPGMTVDRGEPLVVVRHANREPWIDAYLTQEEAGQLEAGSRGIAVVAANGKRYPVEVVAIDRTAGFVNDPQWSSRKPDDRSACARVAFVNLSDAERDSLNPGSPVLVSVPKKRTFFATLLTTAHAAAAAPDTGEMFRVAGSAAPGFEPVRLRLIEAADATLRQPPAPVRTIRSAGVTDQSSPEFQSSRRAFQDADNAAILALAGRITGRSEYREAARRIVEAWAAVNQPTGQPIDETRLDALLWAMDLLGREARTPSVTAWLERWAAAKHNWKFGPNTATNNHKTHHLKILLMLDRLLGREADYSADVAAAEQHLTVNLAENGESLDYRQRDAMHYHVFDLEAWLEIALVTGCCRERIDQGVAFLERRLAEDPAHVEFAKSTARIDKARGDAGFDYAKPHPYDPSKAARMLFAYATLTGKPPARMAAGQHRELFWEARYYLWQRR